jgi:hypothetical protein
LAPGSLVLGTAPVPALRFTGAENWIGGHTKNDLYAQDPLPARMIAELEAAGPDWWPLDGASFAGRYERAHAALTSYLAMAAVARKQRLFY